MAKQDASTLPTLEDFMESNTLLTNKGETSTGPAPEEVETAKVAEDAAKAKKAEDDKKANAGKSDAAAKLAADQAALEVEKAKKAEEDAKKKTGAAAVELTKEQLDALVKKAEANPDTLSDAERKLLVDQGLFKEEGTFWDDVEKIHGVHVDVEYGSTDPESPEGAAIRDQALMDYAVEQNLEFLKKSFPNEFKYLEHASNGGKVEDLLPTAGPDYKKVTLTKEDKDGQKALLQNFYIGKGFDEKRAARMVEADEDSAEGLLAVAQDALKQLQASQVAKETAILEKAKADKELVSKRNEAFKATVKQITDAGQLGDFQIINKKDREDFFAYAVNNIYAEGDGYQVVLPLDEKSLVPVLQQLFFGFKNGDLKEFVRKEAATGKAKRLIKRVSQATESASSQEDETQKAAAAKTKTLPTFDVFKAE